MGPYLDRPKARAVRGQYVFLRQGPVAQKGLAGVDFIADPAQDDVVEVVRSEQARLCKHTVHAFHNLTCLEVMRGHTGFVQGVLVRQRVVDLRVEVMRCRGRLGPHPFQRGPELSLRRGIAHCPRGPVLECPAGASNVLSDVAEDVLKTMALLCAVEHVEKVFDALHAVCEYHGVLAQVSADARSLALICEPLVRGARLGFAKGPGQHDDLVVSIAGSQQVEVSITVNRVFGERGIEGTESHAASVGNVEASGHAHEHSLEPAGRTQSVGPRLHCIMHNYIALGIALGPGLTFSGRLQFLLRRIYSDCLDFLLRNRGPNLLACTSRRRNPDR